jgi:hypothetical protein
MSLRFFPRSFEILKLIVFQSQSLFPFDNIKNSAFSFSGRRDLGSLYRKIISPNFSIQRILTETPFDRKSFDRTLFDRKVI